MSAVDGRIVCGCDAGDLSLQGFQGSVALSFGFLLQGSTPYSSITNLCNASRAVNTSSAATSQSAKRYTAVADIGAAASRDCDLLKRGADPDELARVALWHDAIPKRVEQLWSRLCNALLGALEEWDIWLNWYECRRDGAPHGLPLEHALFSLTNEDWNRGPDHANRKLKEIAERLLESEGEDRQEQSTAAESEPPAELKNSRRRRALAQGAKTHSRGNHHHRCTRCAADGSGILCGIRHPARLAGRAGATLIACLPCDGCGLGWPHARYLPPPPLPPTPTRTSRVRACVRLDFGRIGHESTQPRRVRRG